MKILNSLFILLALIVTPVKADDATNLRMGFGIVNTVGSALYSVSYESTMGHDSELVYKVDVGAWTDSVSGRKASPYGAALIGPQFGSYRGLRLQLLLGVSVIGQTDSFLGSNFQFTEELSVGYKRLSLGYKHISNAGIVQPNMGRDYVFLGIGFPL